MRIIIDIPDNHEQIEWPYSVPQVYRPVIDPCANCQNNPAMNPHAIGICHCTLPAMANPVMC